MVAQPNISREQVEKFLLGFDAVTQRVLSKTPVDLRQFLEHFEELRARFVVEESLANQGRLGPIGDALTGFITAEAIWKEAEKGRASTFNALDALGLTNKELIHSNALAWLFSHNIRDPGSHAQGSLGFRLFLERMNWHVAWSDESYFVRRESSGENSRIDIEIACQRKFVIHIENKIRPAPGERQLERERDDLFHRAAELEINDPASIRAVYLTPTGEDGGVEPFVALSWADVAAIFADFAAKANYQAVMVKLFTAHYADSLRRTIVRNQNLPEQTNGTENIS